DALHRQRGGRAERAHHAPTRARRVRAAGSRRHGRGHSSGAARKNLRAVLHNQGSRQGRRPGPGHHLRHRPAKRRLYLRRQYRRPRHDLYDLLSQDVKRPVAPRVRLRSLRWSSLRLRTKGFIVVGIAVLPVIVFWAAIGFAVLTNDPPANTTARSLTVQASLARVQGDLL